MENYTYTIPENLLTGKPSITVIIRSDGLNIPTDPANSDYQAYLAHLTESLTNDSTGNK